MMHLLIRLIVSIIQEFWCKERIAFQKRKRQTQKRQIEPSTMFYVNAVYTTYLLECQLDIFDRVIQSILLHGSEVWGIENNTVVERVHQNFVRPEYMSKSQPHILRFTGNQADIHAWEIKIKLRVINFWLKLATEKSERLPAILFNFALKKIWRKNILGKKS